MENGSAGKQPRLPSALPADFDDGGAPWYCRECAEVRGLLASYPRLADLLDVRTVDFPRPRPAMVELLGEAHQNAPTLVIGDPSRELPDHIAVKEANGRRFIDSAKAIGEHIAAAYGIGRPHPLGGRRPPGKLQPPGVP